MVEYNISTLLKKGIELLGEGDYFNPLLDAQILLMHLLDVDKIYLYTHNKDEVNREITKEFFKLIELRKNRFPLQYIIGHQEFMGLDFKVRQGVLVPRPDTEVLVEKILEIVNSGYFNRKENEEEKNNGVEKPKLNIVDIGTGSGAITLSLAHFIENSFVYSVDISKTALEVAKENRENLHLEDRVEFLNGSMLQPIKAIDVLQKNVDILVSNPPYIPSKVIDSLQIEVSTYEPRLALDGGEDGLDFYREIVEGAEELLSETSILAFEIGFDQGESVSKLLEKTGLFSEVEVIADLSGNDRVVIGKKS